ncbi:hypothetical protein DMENIID0001_046040 [Sergentomyia squamirostris]
MWSGLKTMDGKIIFLLTNAMLVVLAAPALYNPDLLTYSSSSSDQGYDFSYSTADQTREEHAVLVPRLGSAEPETDLSVRGSYSFYSDDGRLYTVNYIADSNGYRANVTISDSPKEPVSTPVPAVVFIDPNALKSLVG